jgi:hypothetical protein
MISLDFRGHQIVGRAQLLLFAQGLSLRIQQIGHRISLFPSVQNVASGVLKSSSR